MKRLTTALVLFCASACAMAQSASAQAPAGQPHTAPVDSAQFEQARRLAAAGDSGAMLRLGEMYWYGDGLPVDRARGDALFQRALAAGNEAAASATSLSARRQQHLADIAYWTSGVTAAQLTSSEFRCERPVFPPYSDIRVDAVKVVKAYETYRDCYNGYVDKLFGDVPSVRRIPAEVAILMSEEEFDQARSRIDRLVAEAVADLKARSAPVLAERDRWIERSTSYISTQAIRRETELIQAMATYRTETGR